MITGDVASLRGARRIDVHHHVMLPEYLKLLESQWGIVERSARLFTAGTPGAVREVMDEFGIDVAILGPYSSSGGVHRGDDAKARQLTRATNDAAARWVSQAPKRLGFFAIMPLPDLQGALHEMEHALDELDADGVVFLSNQNGRYVGDREFDELYAEMNRRKVVAFVHPAIPPYGASYLELDLWPALVEFVFETTRVAVSLIYNEVMKRYPDIRWILAHAGGTLPFLARRLGMMEDDTLHAPLFRDRVPEGYAPYLKQFYYDTAISGGRAPMAALAEVADPARILYGSDWPYLSKEFTAAQVNELRSMPYFAGPRLEQMERGNALALFRRFAR